VVWRDPSGAVLAVDQNAVSGLCAGTHSVSITDALGCDSVFSFTVLPYTPIADQAAVADVQCNGACDGSIALAASGGIGTLGYSWTPPPPNGQGTPTASSLCPGNWSVLITDAVGCTAQFSYAIGEPAAITIDVDEVVDASCLDASDGSISVTLAGGSGPLSAAWTGPSGFQSNAVDITGLRPGSYQLTVTDGNGCSASAPIAVGALSTVIAAAGPDQTACAGTAVVLDGSQSTGGTAYQWFDAQGQLVGAGAVLMLQQLPPGAHAYTLVVSDGPCASSDQVLVTVLAIPFANAGADQYIFLGEAVQLGGQPTGPVGATYLWSPDSLLTSSTASNPTASPGTTTWFTVAVTGPDGCQAVDSVLITVVPQVVIPSGFTPNGDGWNDTWVIDYIQFFPDCEVEVYNRWGDQLFRSVGYKQPWDGRYRNGLVPVGTYYYVVTLNDDRFPDAYTGPLTVIR
jgi:gliding motility-associated-like protein